MPQGRRENAWESVLERQEAHTCWGMRQPGVLSQHPREGQNKMTDTTQGHEEHQTEAPAKGLTIERRFTTAGDDPYSNIEWTRRDSKIANPDGSVVFEMKDAEIPAAWSQVAADIMVSKYFRKAGVPQSDKDGNPILGPERSAKDVFNRLAETWRHWGEQYNYFASDEDAQAFEDELKYMLANQMTAPNSPQWFNTGLFHSYGITGSPQGFWFVDEESGELTSSPDAYSRPAPHACFPEGTKIETRVGFKTIEDIAIGDEVLTHTGRWRRVVETMSRPFEGDLVVIDIDEHGQISATPNHPIFAMPAGRSGLAPATGLSWIPADKIEAGHTVGLTPIPRDNFTRNDQPHDPGNAIMSGLVATVHRAPFYGTVYNFQVEEDGSYVANGVVVHNCFIQSVDDDLVSEGGIMDLWVREARLFKMGSGTGSNFSNLRAEGEPLASGGKSSGLMSFLKIGDRAAGAIKSGGTTRRAAKMVILDMDHPDIEEFIAWKKTEEEKARILIEHGGFTADFNGEAYATVSGQNSNNSVRASKEFLHAVVDDLDWELTNRTDGKVRKTLKARDLWRQIADAAWACADPGMQYHSTIQEWHTSPAGGEIRATNPCSEYVFLDDTACNLASINLVRFTDDSGAFDIEAYRHAIRIWTVVLEISVTMAHFPSKAIAQGSFDYRTLGLGYANLGSLLMRSGIPYDSDLGRAIAGSLTSILTGESYAASAEMAEVRGAFPRFEENRESMLQVIRNHRRAAYDKADFEDISTYIMGINADLCPPDLLAAAQGAWDKALDLGETHGFRNAQATVLAPTGTIGLLMDCDTTGVEPDFALVKFKKLAGGGYFKIANQSIAPSLSRLDYTPDQVDDILAYVIGTSSLEGAPHVNAESLVAKGFTAEDLTTIEESLPTTFALRFAFNVFSLGTETLQRLGFTEDEYTGLDFDLLAALGFSKDEVTTANNHICGRQTIEGAPHLLDEHLPVFDCANRNGKYGQRFIHHTGHIKMMAAAQPFISGAISKCVTGETLLTTADGLIRIGSLHQSERSDSFRDEVIEVASLDGPQKTDAFYYGGMRSVREITLRNGHRVTGTPNHRLLTAADGDLVWRRLDEIGEGEYVANQYSSDMWSAIPARFDDFTPSRRYGSQKSVRVPEEMTDELAFLLGAYVAEGNITRANWTIHITNADEGVLERTSAAWQSLFDVAAPIRRPKGRCWSVEVSSKEIVEFFDHLGCGDTSYDKRFPDAVLRSPRSMVLEFLSGLFLDGYTTIATAPKMAICVASSALMDDMQAVLTNLGVLHSRVEKYNKDYGRTYHEVYAAGSEAQRLARLVPFAEEYKAARASELLALEFHPNRNTADVIPGLAPRDLYEMIQAGKSGRNGYGERSRFSFLGDPRTRHVTWRTLARVAMLPEVELPEWLHTIITDDLHFSPVTAVGDVGVREVFDVSVPETHAFVGNGIVNHNTINMPNEVTVDEVEEAYMMSWELGIKAMALYRDGSKASQPLSASSDDAVSEELPEEVADALIQETMAAWGQIPAGTSPTAAYSNMPRPRFLLPPRRQGWTQEARIGGHKVFLRAGEYDDGTLGEIFIDLAKEGATLRGVLASFAIAVSKGLQYGVPLEEFVDTFTFQTFEPRGMVEGHPNIKMASSIIDYIFRSLGMEYLKRDELVQVPPDRSGSDLAEPPKGLAAEAGQQLELAEAAKEADIDAQVSAAAFADASAPVSNGNGIGVTGAAPDPAPVKEAVAVAAGSASVADQAMGEMMGDAPVCSSCGHMTVRNGSCYVCLTCGDTTGCS